MKGFKNSFCALIFCTVFEEIREFFLMKNKTCAERRSLIASKFQAFNHLLNCTARKNQSLNENIYKGSYF